MAFHLSITIINLHYDLKSRFIFKIVLCITKWFTTFYNKIWTWFILQWFQLNFYFFKRI